MLLINLHNVSTVNPSLFYRYNTLLFCFFVIFVLSGCASINSTDDISKSYALTAITDTPTNQYYPGKFVWHDLLTSERDKAKLFYSSLFGWTFKDETNYSIIYNQGKKIGGILEVSPKFGQNAEAIWLASMSVGNMDKAVSVVQSHGGQILKGPLNMKKRGQGVLISDPQGAQLILLKSINGDPLNDEIRIGDWLWNEIWTHQPDKTLSFYVELAQYSSMLQKDGYHVLKSQKKWQAGVRQIFNKETKIRWVPTIRVDDPNALLKKVETFGGRVLLKPGEHPSDHNTALIIDNTGALLMIQRWDPQSDKGVMPL